MTGADTPRRIVGIGSAIALMIAAVLVFGPAAADRFEPARYEPVDIMLPGAPIAAEAHVFRTAAGDLAMPYDAARRPTAHRRTLDMFRSLRAYPGAPPRIPHGLTAEEFRTPSCNACHESGGYAARFAAYAPITPHPQLTECLQCHVPDDAIVGVRLPGPGPDDVCLQCHVPGALRAPFRPLDWRPAAWPRTGQRALRDSPPAMPHGLEMRGDCLACHVGPAAVEEIRTTHPERANCRQCHVPAEPAADVFTRPLDRAARPRDDAALPAGGGS